MPIHVIGRMRTYKYTSAEGGEKTFYEVLASKVRFLEAEEFDHIG
jgi:single-stranded DNA-binding protein